MRETGRIWRGLALIFALSVAGPVYAQPTGAQPAQPASASATSTATEATADQLLLPKKRSWLGTALFWSGAAVCMFLVGRVVFREQWNELKTQRALIHRIGPFFPEFDIDAIKTWVERAAPHLWRSWRTRDLEQMRDFLTPEFLEAAQARFEEDAQKGVIHRAELGKILKVHTLGMYLFAEGPPPRNIELILRVETRGLHAVVDPSGNLLEGSAKERQHQHFWTLRHDGHRWRLHQVEVAEGDKTDLGKKPLLPPIMQWKRPTDVAEA